MAKYIIDETTLVGFGDQARRLGNVEGELTTAQMQEIFAGVTADGSGGNAGVDDYNVVISQKNRIATIQL